MAKTERTRISPGATPVVVSENIITDTHDIKDKQTSENLTICKYIGRKKIDDKWTDVVMEEWVSNPQKIDLIGCKIRVEKSIVE